MQGFSVQILSVHWSALGNDESNMVVFDWNHIETGKLIPITDTET